MTIKLASMSPAVFFLMAACASELPIATTVSTINTCNTPADCAGYQQAGNITCSNGACVAFSDRVQLSRFRGDPYGITSPLTFVISLPDTESFGFGQTIVLSSSELTFGGPGADPCIGNIPNNTCIGVSGTFLESGDYETDPSTAAQVLRTLNAGIRSSVPSHTTFRLLTADPASLTTQTATGLPVSPIYGTVSNSFSISLSLSPRGPGNTDPITWRANLHPGRYQREVMPDPPFSDAFPPWRDVVTIVGAQPLPAELFLTGAPAGGTPLDNQANRTYRLGSSGDIGNPDNPIPARDLTGWKAFLRETSSGRIVSSTMTFSAALAADPSVTKSQGDPDGTWAVLNTVTPSLAPAPTPTDQTGTELVLEPPPGTPYPTLVGTQIGGKIPQKQFYPPVPGPALVEGVVVGTAAEPVPSQLDFISVEGSGVLSQDGNNFDLRYRTSVHTAADGSYSVRLPRGAPIKQTTDDVVKGHYNVVVTPDPGTGYAVVLKTLNNAFLVPEDTAGTHDSAVQKGKGFTMSRLTAVTGHVTLTDGRPLGGVIVEARPSSAFDKYDPTIPTELFPLMPVARPATTTTDTNGLYTLLLDPGLYDFFAKAPASSGFAWGVTTAHKTDAPVDIKVPAPIDASLRVYQTNTSTLQGALVRAYVAAGPDLTQIQIGEGATDSEGILTLFLSPELPK